MALQPVADSERRQGIGKLSMHGGRNEDAAVKLREDVDSFNQDKIIEGCCIGDNRRHLQAELAVSFAVAFEVFNGVFELDAVVLEEGVDFHASLEAEQLAQQGRGDFACAIGFEGQCFQGGAGQVLALRGERCEEFIRERNGDVLHGFRILEESAKSTARELKVESWMGASGGLLG
jgi:hypothetical protein